jgi:hypothetical protein
MEKHLSVCVRRGDIALARMLMCFLKTTITNSKLITVVIAIVYKINITILTFVHSLLPV